MISLYVVFHEKAVETLSNRNIEKIVLLTNSIAASSSTFNWTSAVVFLFIRMPLFYKLSQTVKCCSFMNDLWIDILHNICVRRAKYKTILEFDFKTDVRSNWFSFLNNELLLWKHPPTPYVPKIII